MSEQRYCDFCGRPEDMLPEPATGTDKLILDTDNLWVCAECNSRMVAQPVGQQYSTGLEDALLSLVGQSAGAICRTLALPYEPPYKNVLDAASAIAYDQDHYMSAWCFVSQWLDGTTVWRSPDTASKAIVTASGDLHTIYIE